MSGQSKKKPKTVLAEASVLTVLDEDEELTILKAATRNQRLPSTDSLEIVAISKRRRKSSSQIALDQRPTLAPSNSSSHVQDLTKLVPNLHLPKKKRCLASQNLSEGSPAKLQVNFRLPVPEVCQTRRYIDIFPGLPKEPSLGELLKYICTTYTPDPLSTPLLERMVTCCFDSCVLQDALIGACLFSKFFHQLGYSSSDLKALAGLEGRRAVFAIVLKFLRLSQERKEADVGELVTLVLEGLTHLLEATTVPYKAKQLKAIIKSVAPMALGPGGYAKRSLDLHRSCSSQPVDCPAAELCMLHLSQLQGFWEVFQFPPHLHPHLPETQTPNTPSTSPNASKPPPPPPTEPTPNSRTARTTRAEETAETQQAGSLLTYLQLSHLTRTHRPKTLLSFLQTRVFVADVSAAAGVVDGVVDGVYAAAGVGRGGIVGAFGGCSGHEKGLRRELPKGRARSMHGERTAVRARVLRMVFGLVEQIGKKVAFGSVFGDMAEQRVLGFLRNVRLSLEGDGQVEKNGDMAAIIGRIIRRICSPFEKPSEPLFQSYFSDQNLLVDSFLHHGLLEVLEAVFLSVSKITHPEVKLFILAVCLTHQRISATQTNKWRRIITLVEEKLNLGMKRGHHTLAPDGQFEYYERGLLEFCKTYVEKEIARLFWTSSATTLPAQESEFIAPSSLKICKLPIMFEKYCHVMFGKSLGNLWIVEDESMHARFSKGGNETEKGMKYWIKKKSTQAFAQERTSSHHKSLISKPDFIIHLNCGQNSYLSEKFFLSSDHRFYCFNRDRQSLQMTRWQSMENTNILSLIVDVPTLRTALKPRVLHLQWLDSNCYTVLAVGYHRFPNQQNIPFSMPSAYRFLRLPSTKRILDWQLPYNPNSQLTFFWTSHGLVSCSLEPLGYLALEFISRRKSLRFQAVDANNQLIHKVLLHDRYLVVLTSHDVKICEVSSSCRVVSLSSVRTLLGSPFSEGAFLGKQHLVLVSKYDPLKKLACIDLHSLAQFVIWLGQPEHDLGTSTCLSEQQLRIKRASNFKSKVLAGWDPTQYKIKSKLIISRDSTRLVLMQWIPDEPYQASQKYSSVRVCDLPLDLVPRLSRNALS